MLPAILAPFVPAIVSALAERYVAPNAKAIVAGLGVGATIAMSSDVLPVFPTESLGYLLGWSAETTRHVGALVGFVLTVAGVWLARNRPKPSADPGHADAAR